MNHSPSEVLRQLLIDLGLGTSGTTWTVYVNTMPETPDNCISVNDTEAVDTARAQATGVTTSVHGAQILVRGVTFATARAKVQAIHAALDESVLRTAVTVSTTNYVVQAVSRIGEGIPLGTDGVSKRHLHSINVRVSLSQNN